MYQVSGVSALSRVSGVAPDGWPLFMTDRFLTDGQTDFLDKRIFGRLVSKKVLSGLSNGLSKKLLTNCFGHFLVQSLGTFWQILASFGNFWAIFGQKKAFSLADRFFLGGRFFVRTVNSDCLVDKFGGRFEISIIRHHEWLCGSNRQHPVRSVRSISIVWSIRSVSSVSIVRRVRCFRSVISVCSDRRVRKVI